MEKALACFALVLDGCGYIQTIPVRDMGASILPVLDVVVSVLLGLLKLHTVVDIQPGVVRACICTAQCCCLH